MGNLFISAAEAENELLRGQIRDLKAERKEWMKRADAWFDNVLPGCRVGKESMKDAFRKAVTGE